MAQLVVRQLEMRSKPGCSAAPPARGRSMEEEGTRYPAQRAEK